MTALPTIQELIDRKALFVVNHSGGKDSQAMMINLLKVHGVPVEQMLVVHATLGDIEWEGALELAEKQAREAGVPFLVAQARNKKGEDKDFFDLVEGRMISKQGTVPPFPSASNRQCTSDLKRGPIERVVGGYIRERGITLVVNCEGIRAAESVKRSKADPFHRRHGTEKCPDYLDRAGREGYNWMPIFDMSTAEVFETIRKNGQEPHWAYAQGNERLSCVFCIMGSVNDLRNGAKHRPELFARYVAWEQASGYTMHESRKSLTELVGEATL
jgi:3'-phosphoadenosine 5'-phosphosulfate sulfotransferase (PAPS reductase)/FAD synthetase